MTIALVSAAYPPETANGGTSTQAHAKAHGLAELGHHVHVVSRSTDGKRRTTQDGPVTVHRVPGADPRLTVATEIARWVTDSVEVAAGIERLHGEVALDIVDLAEWASEGFVHLLNRADWQSIPTVVQLHGPLAMLTETIGWPEPGSPLERVGRVMEGECLRLADAVYASSRLSAQWCAKAYGLPLDDVPVWHCGVDTARFHPEAAPRDPGPMVVFVGRLAPSKGIDDLLEAALALARRHPRLRLRLIGGGEPGYVQSLHERAGAAGHPALVETPGPVANEELPAQLAAATVFAAPSWFEGGPGLVYLEAMACGLPVVASDGSGASEVVTHGQTGLLVAPHDVAALVAEVDRLLTDDAEATRLGTAARAAVVAHHDRQHRMPWLEGFYTDVVDRFRT